MTKSLADQDVPKSCLGKTTAGEPCAAKPTASGYCATHDPSRAAQIKLQKQKKEKLEEVLESVLQTARAKGWYAHVASRDQKGWKYASVSVRGEGIPSIEGKFDITLENGVRIHPQQISFHGHGLDDLMHAITSDLGNLPWLVHPDKKKAEPASMPTTSVEKILKRFHLVARQLQRRHADRDSLTISDEYDVQDLLHALLRIDFDDIRPEESTPSYAGGSARVDFLLKKEKIIIEAKFATAKLRDKQIGEELMVDVQRYQSHPDCETLICFVYDPGSFLKNPVGLAADLTKKYENMIVKVIIVP